MTRLANFGLGLLALAVVAGWLFVLADREEPDLTGAKPLPQTSVRGNPDDQTVVVVVGDSFVAGTDMNVGPEWPTLLGDERDWIVKTSAVSGTGYVNGGADDAGNFAARLPDLEAFEADLVILAGGRNDTAFAAAEGANQAREDIATVRRLLPTSRVVVFSPFASGTATPDLVALSEALATVAEEAKVPYVNVLDFVTPKNIGKDGVHPNDAGHAELAVDVLAALKAIGEPRPGAWKPDDVR